MSFSKIKPLTDRVILKSVEIEIDKEESLIEVPDNLKERPQTAEVVSVGPEVDGLSIGDTILHSKYSGDEFELGDETYLILRRADVIGILE